MRSVPRSASTLVASTLALAAVVALTLTLPLAGSALAAPTPRPGASSDSPGTSTPGPSRAQVKQAQRDVTSKKQSVTQIESALAAATTRMEQASMVAEQAAERYNGARWRLGEAQKAHRLAVRRSALAKAKVQQQRSGIVTLVTESYQNGTELNTATALMSDEGPRGLMNRYAVVASAGDSMDARYADFRTASAHAKTYAARAAKAEKTQNALAASAKDLAVEAGRAVAAAGVATNEIAVQKQQLVRALAKAQHISVALATQRHAALELVAQRKAAAAARARQAAAQAAEQARLRQAADAARRRAEAQARAAASASSDAAQSRSDEAKAPAAPSIPSAPPVISNPAPNQSVAVKRVIAYAKQQLGKPYLWAASGPGSFDCSGLTMQAWARAGVSLPHYSVAQFEQSTRVSMADAKPGDLLFWSNDGTPGGIHHVALYLGGGQFLEAPHTGAFVRYNSVDNWYPDFVARP